MRLILSSFLATLDHVLRDRAAFTTIVVACAIYAFYYPAAYQHQVATRIPVVVVDLDRSSSSRDLIRRLGAVRDIQSLGITETLAEGRVYVEDGSVDGILVIDQRFEKDILRGEQGKLTFLTSGALLGRSSTVSQGLSLAVAGFSKDAVQGQVKVVGAPADDALSVVQRPLFNTREGYASAVVTGVSVLIVHQTLLTGMVLLLGTSRESRGRRISLTLPAFVGTLAAFWVLGTGNTLFYAGFVFWFQDFPRGGNLAGLIAGASLYISATVAFGAFIGSFFRVREHALQIVLMTSMPLYFLCGLSWPRSSMPEFIAWLSDLLPSTSGVITMVKFNQMGASVGEAFPELTKLLLLTVGYGALAYLRYRPRSKVGESPQYPDLTL